MASKFLIPTILSLAGVGALAGVGLDIMGNTLSQAYPDTPHWIWLSLFWFSVALVVPLLLWIAWHGAQLVRPIFPNLEFTWPIRRKKLLQPPPLAATLLSPGERQFKTELRSFIKSNFDEIRDAMYKLNQSIIEKCNEQKGHYPKTLSWFFQQLFEVAIRPDIDAVDKVYELQVDDFDTRAVQDLIKKAIQSYKRWQEMVVTFGIIPDDRSLGILHAADERAYGKLRDLKASPYVTILSDHLDDSIFISRNNEFSQWNDSTKIMR